MGIKELCNCEGCFKDHNLELSTSQHNLTIKSRIAEALEYREELLQYNSKP